MSNEDAEEEKRRSIDRSFVIYCSSETRKAMQFSEEMIYVFISIAGSELIPSKKKSSKLTNV